VHLSSTDDDNPTSPPPRHTGTGHDHVDVNLVVRASDGIELSGTLARPPKSTSDAPAVLFLNGSGPLDRDSNFPGQALNVASTFADHLAGAGIASLRFDKRGVGASKGDFATTGLDLEISDAAVCFAALGSCDDVDADRVAIVGHSVGATIAMRLAADRTGVAAVVLLAGPAQPGIAVMDWQTERMASSLPGPDWLLPAYFRRRTLKDRAALLESRRHAIRPRPGALPAGWVQDFAAHDPSDDLGRIDCPVLAITGLKDLQVDPNDVARMATMVRGPFAGATPADLTHLLRHESGRGGLRSYTRQVRRPVDPELLERVTTWLATLLAPEC